MAKEEVNRKTLIGLLSDKSSLKQDIAQDTTKVFDLLKKVIEQEVTAMRPSIKDHRVRLSVQDKGDYESLVLIGSDALFFQKHSNVFLLPPEHELWKEEGFDKDPKRTYFGIINIFNFLADSILHGRMNDSGFLIGRIFVNYKREVFVEGRGQLNFLFKSPQNNPVSESMIKHIVQCAFAYSLEFDLYAPPYEVLEEISVEQISAMSADLGLKTSKRMGFKHFDE